MNISRETIPRLEKIKNDTEAKIQQQRADILKYITIDPKFNVIVDPQYKDRAKEITECIFALHQEKKKVETLIAAIKDAAAELNCGNFDFVHKHNRLISGLGTNERLLQQGVINGLLSKERCEMLEVAISEAKKGLDRYNEIIPPILKRLEAIN